MQLISMKVFDPYEEGKIDFNKMVKDWITDPKPGYLRV
jgi:transketolase